MEGSEDRISELPEAILHHIFSFLFTKEVIQAAATSKRLNHVWSTIPYLDLGPNFFPVLPRLCPLIDFDHDADEYGALDIEYVHPNMPEIHRKREKLFTFVDQTLTRRRMLGLTIQKFQLGVTRMDVELSQYLDRWILYLVQCNIKELILQVSCDFPAYDLPPILFTATSLCALTLKLCKMPMPCGSITMSSLRKLHLESVYLDDQIMGDIIKTCLNLEDLHLYACHGLKKIIVSGLSQLRVLMVTPHCYEQVLDEVVVEATNLEMLSYTTANLPCKINIITKFDGSLKCLWLSGANITDVWFCELISRLPCLEELFLANLNLNAITISSSSLKRLRLARLFDFKGRGVGGEVTIDAPCLISFSYTGCSSIVFLNNLAVKEVDLQITDIHVEDTVDKLCSKWLEFLRIFDYSEVVKLDCSFFEKIVFPVKLNILAPLAHIRHLIVRGRFETSANHVLGEVIHSLLRISPNLDTLSLEDSVFEEESHPISLVIKFYSEEVAGSRDCISFPWGCRRQCVTHMNIDLKNTNGVDDEVYSCLKNYFNTLLPEELSGHCCKFVISDVENLV